VLLEDIDDLGGYFVHLALPPCPEAGMSGPCWLIGVAQSRRAWKVR
jgi:hypothetical protein